MGISKRKVLVEKNFIKWLKRNPDTKFCVSEVGSCPVAQFILEKTGVEGVEVGWGSICGYNGEPETDGTKQLFGWNWPKWVAKFVGDFDSTFANTKRNKKNQRRVSGKRIVREMEL